MKIDFVVMEEFITDEVVVMTLEPTVLIESVEDLNLILEGIFDPFAKV